VLRERERERERAVTINNTFFSFSHIYHLGSVSKPLPCGYNVSRHTEDLCISCAYVSEDTGFPRIVRVIQGSLTMIILFDYFFRILLHFFFSPKG